LHPQYRQTVHTYNPDTQLELVGEDADLKAGPESLLPYIDENTALVIVQYPDFFGRIYDLENLVAAAHAAGALVY